MALSSEVGVIYRLRYANDAAKFAELSVMRERATLGSTAPRIKGSRTILREVTGHDSERKGNTQRSEVKAAGFSDVHLVDAAGTNQWVLRTSLR